MKEIAKLLCMIFLVLAVFTSPVSAIPVVSMGDVGALPAESITVPVMVNSVSNLGSGVITVTYNSSVVHVTDVTSGTGNALMVQAWNVDNIIGAVQIVAWNASGPQSGDVIFASVTYRSVGNQLSSTPLNITVRDLTDYNYSQIVHTVSNGKFTILPSGTFDPAPPGGGGGSGGGVSGESFANIELKEKQALRIFKDRITSYPFVSPKNPVMFVNITGRSNAGEITVTVEVLHSTSSLVKTDAPDIVYKNLNIWVGTAGFATPENIKEGVIMFRVNRSWIDSNEIDPASITLLRYDLTTDTWNPLPTQRIGKNDAELYYQAATDRFSPFAITGKNASALMPAAAGGAAAEAAVENTANETDISSTSENHAAAVLIIGLIVILVTATALYIYKRKYY